MIMGKTAIFSVSCTILLLLSVLLPLHAQAGAKPPQCSLAAGNVDEARAYYDKAVEQAPESSTAFRDRGFFFLKINRRDLAIVDFTRAIELQPELADGYLSRGLVYSDAGDATRANADFKKACDLGDPSGCSFLKQSASGG